MTTKLLEFENKKKDILRGILVSAIETKKDYIIVMLGGFERTTTTERKFKALADKLAQKGLDSFRFDVTDVGLSDGDFYHSTTQSFSDDLSSSITFLKGLGYKKVSFVGHSHAACAFSLLNNKTEMEKVVLLAPGLNQKGLFRMWFAQGGHPEAKINYLII
jgi:esterase/lipase